LTNLKRRMKKEQRELFFRRFISNKMMLTGCLIMLFLILITIVGPFLVKQDPLDMVIQDRLEGPSLEHLLGTDEFGRDLLSRIVHGSKVTMGVGFAVAAITSFFG